MKEFYSEVQVKLDNLRNDLKNLNENEIENRLVLIYFPHDSISGLKCSNLTTADNSIDVSAVSSNTNGIGLSAVNFNQKEFKKLKIAFQELLISLKLESNLVLKSCLKRLFLKQINRFQINSEYSEYSEYTKISLNDLNLPNLRQITTWISQLPDLFAYSHSQTEQYITNIAKQLVYTECLETVVGCLAEAICKRGFAEHLLMGWLDFYLPLTQCDSVLKQPTAAENVSSNGTRTNSNLFSNATSNAINTNLNTKNTTSHKPFNAIIALIDDETLTKLIKHLVKTPSLATRLSVSTSTDLAHSLLSLVGRSNWTHRNPLIELITFTAYSDPQAQPVFVDSITVIANALDRASIVLAYLVRKWANESFVETASVHQHTIIAIGILGCLRVLRESNNEFVVDSLVQAGIMSGIPLYLGTGRKEVGELGLVVSQVSSACFGVQGVVLGFEGGERWEWVKGVFKKGLKCGGNDSSVNLSKGEVKVPAGFEGVVGISGAGSGSIGKKVGHHYFGARFDTDKTPRFIGVAIELIRSGEPGDVQIGMGALADLVSRAAETEVNEMADVLFDVLLPLQNEYNLPGFEQGWNAALVGMCLRVPRFSSEQVCSSLFVQELSLICKIRGLTTLLALPLLLQKGLENKSGKSDSQFALLFADGLLKRIKSTRNWDYIFSQSFHLRLAQAFITSLGYFIETSKSVISLDLFDNYGDFLLSLRRLRGLELEIMHGITSYFKVVAMMCTTNITEYPIPRDLAQIMRMAEEIGSKSRDEQVLALYSRLHVN